MVSGGEQEYFEKDINFDSDVFGNILLICDLEEITVFQAAKRCHFLNDNCGV